MKKKKDIRELNQSFIKPKLTVEECRPILCADGDQYTDEEIEEIIAFILNIVEIDYLYYMRCKQKQQQNFEDLDNTKQIEELGLSDNL